MEAITQTIIQTLSFLTVVLDVVIVIAIFIFVLEKFFKVGFASLKPICSFIAKRALPLAFTVALITTICTLFFSDVVGYEPCKLCWIQRIFMYPQVFLLGMALLWKDDGIVKYIILLSGIGAIIALYHYYLQLGGISFLPCSATIGTSLSCTQRFFQTFGYITIPMMSLTAFLSNLILMLIKRSASVSK